MYANKIYNLKWSIFLERSKLPRLNHKEIENLNRLATSKNIKSVIKNFPTKKSPVPFAFTGEFCYTLKDLTPILFSLSENWRGHNTSKVISLIPKPDKDNTRKQNYRSIPNLPASVGDTRDMGSITKIPWRRKWQTTPVFLLDGLQSMGLQSQTWLRMHLWWMLK